MADPRKREYLRRVRVRGLLRRYYLQPELKLAKMGPGLRDDEPLPDGILFSV